MMWVLDGATALGMEHVGWMDKKHILGAILIGLDNGLDVGIAREEGSEDSSNISSLKS